MNLAGELVLFIAIFAWRGLSKPRNEEWTKPNDVPHELNLRNESIRGVHVADKENTDNAQKYLSGRKTTLVRGKLK